MTPRTPPNYAHRVLPRDLHTVLPSSSSTLEKAIVYAFDGAPTPTVISHIKDADNVDSHLLNALAYERNVDYWSMGATEGEKRAVLKEAVKLHRLKGTVFSVKRVLSLMNVTADIVEWWQESPKADPYTFKIDLLVGDGFENQEVLSKERIEQIVNAVDYWKPISRHFSYRVGVQYTNTLRVTNAHQRLQVARFSCEAKAVQPNPFTNTLRVANVLGRGLQIMRLTMECPA